MTRHFSLAPESTIAHYQIDSKIGAGGMGEVYKAHDQTLERPVALKVLPPSLLDDVDRVRRFVQEAKSASALNHPNIVTIYEIGQSSVKLADGTSPADSIHYIAMEFIEGTTLRNLIYSDTPRVEILYLLAQVADGLAKAHAAGIVHRDLKPDNVMVTNDQFAKVVDFGLAKLTERKHGKSDPKLTQEGMVVGTVGYMSPEQVEGASLDWRSDIFAYGCILYEAMTKKRPFQSELAVDTLHKIVFAEPPPMATISERIPPQLEEIVVGCLKKKPAERYQSMKEIAAAIRQLPQSELGDPRDAAPTVMLNISPTKTPSQQQPAPEFEKPAPVSQQPVRRVRRWTFNRIVSTTYRTALLLALLIGAYAYFTLPDVAALAESFPTTAAVLQNRDGISQKQASFNDVSSSVRKAVVASSDPMFYDREPLKVKNLQSSAMSLVKGGKPKFLPSPISRDVARLVYTHGSLNPLNRVREWAIGAAMEQKLSRRRILELYLNLNPYGETVGIAAASHRYFRKTPATLGAREASLLAAASALGVAPDASTPELTARQEQIAGSLGVEERERPAEKVAQDKPAKKRSSKSKKVSEASATALPEAAVEEKKEPAGEPASNDAAASDVPTEGSASN